MIDIESHDERMDSSSCSPPDSMLKQAVDVSVDLGPMDLGSGSNRNSSGSNNPNRSHHPIIQCK